ncbi:MAG: hypothetical protein V9G19_18495 [Tetrasphaera sp.]
MKRLRSNTPARPDAPADPPGVNRRRSRSRGLRVAGVAIAALLTKPRPDAYTDAWAAVVGDGWRPATPRRINAALRALDLAASAGLLARAMPRRALGRGWAFGPALFTASRFIGAKGLPGRWQYDTFLEPLVWLTAADRREGAHQTQLVGAVCRTLLFAAYSQAGASKLIHGRRAWLIRGDALHAFLGHLGRPAARPAGGNTRALTAVTRLVPLAELAALPAALILPAKTRPIAAGLAILFHTTVWWALDIPFWPLFASIAALAETDGPSDAQILLTELRRRRG